MKKLILSLLSFSVLFVTQVGAQVNPIQADQQLQNVQTIDFQNNAITRDYIYKARLDSITQTVPLSYNTYVQSFIDLYSKRNGMMGKMMGLSNYYFPIFEKALKAYDIPAEIKYLPIIESAMDPHAISKVGATGMWQFMFATAKAYGLNMDNFVDERKDPIQASYAAAAYFRDAYDEFGDWLLAIAAYNCGKGNVTRAIEKAGSRDFWQIRVFLPKETRDYVPKFIAAVYVMNYAEAHEIKKQETAINYQTDTVHVNRFVALADLAKAINYDEATLFVLNPSYKKKIVNGTTLLPKRVILPRVSQMHYAQLYDVLNVDIETDRSVVLAATDDVRELRKKNMKGSAQQPKSAYITYKVKVGDTLSGIAEKFDGATVKNIKKANGLTKANIQAGMLLKIIKG